MIGFIKSIDIYLADLCRSAFFAIKRIERLSILLAAGKEWVMLIFQEFIQKLINQLQITLGESHKIVIKKDLGINQVNQTHLSIKWDAMGESPRTCLEQFYKVYSDRCVSMEDILDYELYLLEAAKRGEIAPFIRADTDYKSVKDNLRMVLVNFQANTELLKQHPYMLLLDLAAIFYIASDNENTECVEFIDNSHMKAWGVNVKQMYQDAYDNMRNLQQTIIKPLTELLDTTDPIFPFFLEGLVGGDKDCIFTRLLGEEVFWFMSTGPCYGAAAMLHEEKLYEFAMEHRCNLYILPSSIHEVLLTEEDVEETAKQLAEYVKDINCSILEQEDLLSNSVYYYDRLERKISIAELGELELSFIISSPMS